jgi:hypothetical protein
MSRFSGARIGEDQKLKFLNELLDAALEQFVSFPPNLPVAVIGN